MRTRQPVVLDDLLQGGVAEPAPVVHEADVDAARERLAAHQATQEQHVRQKRRAVVTEAVEVIDELHRIVANAVEANDDVDPTTEALVRTVTRRAIQRTGANVEIREVSVESYTTPKERLLLSIASLDEVKDNLSAEADNLAESDPEPQTPPSDVA